LSMRIGIGRFAVVVALSFRGTHAILSRVCVKAGAMA